MLADVLARGLPTALYTVYYPRFPEATFQRIAVAGLTVFADYIVRAAFARGLPLLDLHVICAEEGDYADPIEPSAQGGKKIARAVAALVQQGYAGRRLVHHEGALEGRDADLRLLPDRGLPSFSKDTVVVSRFEGSWRPLAHSTLPEAQSREAIQGLRFCDSRAIVGTTDLAEERTAVMVDRPGHWGMPVSKPLEEAAVQELAANLRGDLVRPEDDGYDAARAVFNGMIDKRPAMIVRCGGTSDVIRGVNFARTHDLLLSVRGGGHSVAGNAVSDGGLMLDLSPMKGVRVDPARRTAQAQAGLTLGEFDHETQEFGLATTLGVVSVTGIAGLTLGGGLGWLNGKHGLACDNLFSADVVTAEGRLLTASEEENEDLFWGIRGGGGNFGVVTSFGYRLHPVGPVLGGGLRYSAAEARDVLRFYHEFASTCPDELSTAASLGRAPDGSVVAGVAVCYCGPIEAGERVLRPLRAFGSPLEDNIQPMSYRTLQSAPDAGFPLGRQHYWKSSWLKHLSDEAIEVMVGFVTQMPSPASGVGFQQMHGAASRVDPAATAFPHRDEHYDFLILSQWADTSDSEENIQWTRAFFEAMQSFFEKGVYVNNLGEEGEDRVKEAYGAHYERLVALKDKYDPTNLFRLNQNVKPAARSGAMS